MRLGMVTQANGFFSFLLFLRLAFVTFMCVPGVLIISRLYGPAYAVLAGATAYVLWWYHFGLPRFKVQGDGFFSPRFCFWGYAFITLTLLVNVLMLAGVLPPDATRS